MTGIFYEGNCMAQCLASWRSICYISNFETAILQRNLRKIASELRTIDLEYRVLNLTIHGGGPKQCLGEFSVSHRLALRVHALMCFFC